VWIASRSWKKGNAESDLNVGETWRRMVTEAEEGGLTREEMKPSKPPLGKTTSGRSREQSWKQALGDLLL